MKLKEALKKLGIEEYEERIFKSNSHGELFHLSQYFVLCEIIKEPSEWFTEWFKLVVEQAEEEWERPESVFQHINTILANHLKES